MITLLVDLHHVLLKVHGEETPRIEVSWLSAPISICRGSHGQGERSGEDHVEEEGTGCRGCTTGGSVIDVQAVHDVQETAT